MVMIVVGNKVHSLFPTTMTLLSFSTTVTTNDKLGTLIISRDISTSIISRDISTRSRNQRQIVDILTSVLF